MGYLKVVKILVQTVACFGLICSLSQGVVEKMFTLYSCVVKNVIIFAA